MAKVMRSVDTRFWIDSWIRKLNALDRYVFLYFLTNPHSSWCGVYEVDLAMVAFETGIEETELKTSILPRIVEKIVYVDGWVYIKNFERYHANHSEKTQKGIENAWKEVPERIRLKLKEFEGTTYPIKGVSASASSFTSAFTPTVASYKSLSFLRTVPDDVKTQLSEKYKIAPKGIQEKATDLLLYCEQKGKVYKNYKSFLENAVRKDKRKLQDEFPYVTDKKTDVVPVFKPTPEQVEKTIKIKEEIAKIASSKKMGGDKPVNMGTVL